MNVYLLVQVVGVKLIRRVLRLVSNTRPYGL